MIDIINIILVLISAVCTGVSIYSAFKSKKYYKNSKNLIIHKSITIASKECQAIIEIFPQLLFLANIDGTIGKNVNIIVAQYGKDMKNSMSKIRENMYEKDFKDVKKLLDSKKEEIERYIDSLISGKRVENNIFIENDFDIFQNNINIIQELIKDRFDTISEKLK